MSLDSALSALSGADLPLPAWPRGCRAAVSLTFDVDAEAGPVGTALDTDRPVNKRVGAFSMGAFGVRRGLARILEELARFDVRGTFYVPGLTAELHPEGVRAIASAGHEIGHHGFAHRRMNCLDPAGQREEIAKGIAALEACSGRPKGYRAPGWELPIESFELLAEFGFQYDSSLMGDDRPYRVAVAGVELLELPVHWSLDDWPYLGFNGETGNLADPRVPLRVWLDEFDAAAKDGRHVTYTMHPEVIGRGYGVRVLVELLSGLRERNAAFLTHGELAEMLSEPGGAEPA
jgi:peptidoglycan/xylan/chitin deacetylase (PgdA/CDA1 family)